MTPLHQPRLADHLVERVKAIIHERKLEAGMRLPAERQLAAELGVSRSSLREAIQKLISEHVLISRRGGGTYVRFELQPWSEQRIVEPLRTLVAEDPNYRYDILEARHAIEASTAWHAAMRATEADKEKLQYCFDATLMLKESDHPDLAAQADVRFHLAIAEASHNVVLLQTMRGFFDLMQSSVMHSRQRMYTAPTIFARLTEQHRELLQAILAGDPDRASKAAKAHLGFVHSTIKNLHEDEARQARITRLPDEETNAIREGNP
ncbi:MULTISPECIES: transcriptional regulator LldR [Hafnia]|uniref:Putative L-lactate dehydrogenase operon regulatory protein n=1 Tax=Hafnia alvei ATCC 51873 TaxID=1002364 RepID=G9YCT1_HAFAL|nr:MULTISPECIES: transcriptional regulator LldR [Hafnia]AJQ98277.1 Lactate-responsive regulator LldR in Enterobacteria, GntR family [Enterobacteriaceae bacterium bta3-1]EHM38289.1 putative L-lactate dehydrogenase operon regulatory protein [Hafnia alvei ATCC 51873]OFS09625.1 transcriptional regulator LldR [Hafnia sp. HMSC23F03]QQE45867.1 transcriptional regulator LldR [Hafnia alvei]